MFTYENIYSSYMECRKNKRNTSNALEFEMNIVENLWNLHHELSARTYKIGKSICFLTSSPKLREIFTADFRDRIVYHLLVKELEKVLYLANKIIYHDPTRNYSFKGDKTKLKLLPEHKTLFKIPKSKGLPIGNLTSQFFANIYMNDFDNYVKRVLKVKHYIRYVDDFVLFDRSKEKLETLYFQIKNYLRDNLALELREDTKLQKHSQGLNFLGYIIRENYILTRKRVVNNYKYKKARYLDTYEKQKGKMKLSEIKKFLSVKASFESHTKHSNSYNLNQTIGVLNESNPFDYDRA